MIDGFDWRGLGARVFGAAAVLAASLTFSTFDAATTSARACGVETDCKIGDRWYRIRMPSGHDGTSKVGAIFFMHGWRGSPVGVMGNRKLAKAIDELGVALVAPKSLNVDWDIPNSPRPGSNVELAFFDRLIDDVSKRFAIDRKRLLATGFSAGGMMVWNLICHRSQSFQAFVPLAGTFWRPVPDACDTPPANVVHVHGTTDKMVPLTGRPIGNRAHQGDVFKALALYRRHGAFGEATEVSDRDLTCDRARNGAGLILSFCRHSGGHWYRPHHITRVWRLMEKQGAL
ncbi:MAG: prolyl oligopeptidase family serine peptidase [Pseudomonadota bacterium]